MVIGQSKAVQVLNTYLNFCKTLQREGNITDDNFNRIRFINSCIKGQQDEIREVWGNIFDEIYSLLQKTEIKFRLEREEREIELLRQKRSFDKRKSLSNLESQKSSQKNKFSKNSTASSKQIKNGKKTGVKQTSLSDKNNIGRKQKQSKRKNQEYKIEEKTIEQRLEIFWRSVVQAKHEEEARKKLSKQNHQPIRKVPPMYAFDDSSIFEDIMDEQRAEGKGYGGSK